MDFIEEPVKNPGKMDPVLTEEIKNIPSKMSFKIGETARLLKVKPYVLRYWESEFEMLHPSKMPGGQRLYFRKDVETALLIKKLLYRDRFSIKGAKQALSALKKENRQLRKQTEKETRMHKKLNLVLQKISDLQAMVK